MAIETGDKVLTLLLAKVACCFGLALAATGALGSSASGCWTVLVGGCWAPRWSG